MNYRPCEQNATTTIYLKVSTKNTRQLLYSIN